MNLYKDLCLLIGPEKTSINETMLNQHSGDESHHPKMKPDAVVFPESAADVVKIVTYADAYRVPVIPFGVRILLL